MGAANRVSPLRPPRPWRARPRVWPRAGGRFSLRPSLGSGRDERRWASASRLTLGNMPPTEAGLGDAPLSSSSHRHGKAQPRSARGRRKRPRRPRGRLRVVAAPSTGGDWRGSVSDQSEGVRPATVTVPAGVTRAGHPRRQAACTVRRGPVSRGFLTEPAGETLPPSRRCVRGCAWLCAGGTAMRPRPARTHARTHRCTCMHTRHTHTCACTLTHTCTHTPPCPLHPSEPAAVASVCSRVHGNPPAARRALTSPRCPRAADAGPVAGRAGTRPQARQTARGFSSDVRTGGLTSLSPVSLGAPTR